MKILVTGGSGFIGSHVVERLARDGHSVTILCRTSPRTTSRASAARWLAGDILDPASVRAACESQDAVVHAAGLVGASASWADHRRVNGTGTRRLVHAAIAASVPRLVHVSSLVVHSEPGRDEVIRECSPLLPRAARWDHYARSKLLAERIVGRAAEQGRIVVIVIRPGVVLGPRDRVTTPFLVQRLSQRAHLVVGGGRNVIPWVAVEDLADAISRAATQPGMSSDVFDIAADRVMTQRDILAAHAGAIGRRSAPIRVPVAAACAGAAILDWFAGNRRKRNGPPHRMAVAIAGVHAHVDSSHAAAGLGWSATGSCDSAIRRAVEWELTQNGHSRPRSSWNNRDIGHDRPGATT